jgi:hypothetical protein
MVSFGVFRQREFRNPDDNVPTLRLTPAAWAAFTATR